MATENPPSFSPAQKWSVGLNVALSILALGAILLMVNYLGARHFTRFSLTASRRIELSPRTTETLAALTNDIKVTLYYDREEPLYESVKALLKEYMFACARLQVETVDYRRDPGAAQLVKAAYQLSQATDKNLVIFDCNKRWKAVTQGELSDLDVQALISGKSREVRRTHFKGEMLFTSAILNVTTLRTLKAYFLQGHGEHQPDSEDKLMGYSEFAGVLRENNIERDKLSLAGAGEVPADCHLLIIAGPRTALLPEELDKIDRYLRQGGRLFAAFSYSSAWRPLGLEALLAGWGVAVGNNVVFDSEHTYTEKDMAVSRFGSHPVTRPLAQSALYLLLPRSVGKAQGGGAAADGVTVDAIAFTGDRARVETDLRKDGAHYPGPRDYVGPVPLIVAAEKGRLTGVTADRGATRLVVCGDSIFLGNETINKAANRDFVSLAVNWLLDRSQYVTTIRPQPIKEYRLNMTKRQMLSARWVLMLGMPGAVMLVGLLVAVRRRK